MLPAFKDTVARISRYALVRLLVLALMLFTGLYLAVIAVNFGGFIDDIYRANIDEAIQFTIPPDGMTPEESEAYFAEMRATMEEAYGLNTPFLVRCLRWTWDAMFFNWGDTFRFAVRDGSSNQVFDVVSERLSNTLLLFGTANLLLFFSSIAVAFPLSRHYGSLPDRLVNALTFTSSIPSWLYGAILTIIFSVQLQLLPVSGMLDTFPEATLSGQVWMLFRHMALPVGAILLGAFVQSVTTWRTFFIMQSGEDYVEMARARGLPNKMIERRYILRPALPYIITSFAMLMLGMWQGSMALEVWFVWPGLGDLFVRAIRVFDRSVVLAIIVTFAYVLTGTVFLLDIFYALLDPRIRIGGEQQGGAHRAWKFPAPSTWFSLLRSRLPSVSWRLPALKWKPVKFRRPDFKRSILPFLREFTRYPSAMLGSLLILLLVVLAVHTLVTLPYDQAVLAWRADRAEFYRMPRNARPAWFNWFRVKKLPETIILPGDGGSFSRTVTVRDDGSQVIADVYAFDFPYHEAPQDLELNFSATYREKKPFVALTLVTPDERRIVIDSFSVQGQWLYSMLNDERAQRRFGKDPLLTLFSAPGSEETLPGPYRLEIVTVTFEKESTVSSELLLLGKVYGVAGTDFRRRDLGVALAWGAPVALAFGLLGAVFTSILSMLLAAISAWNGGWIDQLIQRLTEINMILPSLPIAMTVFFIYSKSIWVILAVVVLLNILGGTLKNYRAIFLQVKQAPYIEAAQAYGASDAQLIWRYLVPRVVPLLIPQLVVSVPGFVFLEATLAFLRVSDIYLPTWGKTIYEAFDYNALQYDQYWILLPIGMLLLTGLAFSLLGVALDHILNPRLHEK